MINKSHKTNIRKRLLIFGSTWLFLCTATLTVYLVSQARHSLLESTIKRSQLLAKNLAEQARTAIYSGNQEAVEDILKELKALPEVVEAKIEYGIPMNDDDPERQDLRKGTGKDSKPIRPRVVIMNGTRAIESHAYISTLPGTGTPADLTLFNPTQKEDSNEHGFATVLISVEPIYEEIDKLGFKAAVFLAVVLLAGLVLGWLVSGRMISPLRQLAVHVSNIAEESLAEESINGTPVSGGSNDEIDVIRDILTRMKDSLDNKTAALADLNFSFEDKVRKQTADLEKRNKELGSILNLKNDLIMQLTHELNTPLDALINHLSYISVSANGSLNGRQRDRLERTLLLCQRIRRMITVILEFAVRESGKIQLKREKVLIAEVASQVVFLLDSLQKDKNVLCVVNESIFGKAAFADPDHVEQILLNLVNNAIKASTPNDTVFIEAVENKSSIEIRVIDRGSGIPPALRDKLFHANVKHNMAHGHGVGLFISRCLVELQGGRIWFETDPENGTTFLFTLPRFPSQEGCRSGEAAQERKGGSL